MHPSRSGLVTPARDFLTNRYHYLALPLIGFLVAYPAAALELIRNGSWTASFDYSSAVFPITYATSVAAFALFIALGRRTLGWVVATLYSFSNVVGAIGLYELVLDEFFPNTDYLLKLLCGTFVLFGLISLRVTRVSSLELWLIVAWVSIFFVWVFVAPSLPTARSDTAPFLFNSVTKVGGFVVFSFPLYLGLRSRLAVRTERRDALEV